MGLRAEIDLYYEKMFKLQYEASEGIQHKLVKGELREKFLKQFLTLELEQLNVQNGILADDEWQSSQGDCFVLKKDARLGNMNIYDIEDCKIFMEIKSKVTKAEFSQLNEHAVGLKQKNPKIIVGMFSYSAKAKKKTVLPQFGFEYDNIIDMYGQYECDKDMYPNIDFYYNLNVDKQNNEESPFFIAKDISGDKILFLQSPVIANFINVFRRTIY